MLLLWSSYALEPRTGGERFHGVFADFIIPLEDIPDEIKRTDDDDVILLWYINNMLGD